jgi:hypothetical protein
MFIKTFIAGTAAALISASSLAVSTGSAAAGAYGYGQGYPGYGEHGGPAYPGYDAPNKYGGHGTYGGHGFGGGRGGGKDRFFLYGYKPHRQICKPAYKSVQVWNPWYGWTWQMVYAGQSCSWAPHAWGQW